MDDADEQTPILTVTCPNCGRENESGRLFCKFCRHRMASRPPEEIDSNGQAVPSAEAQQMQAALQAVQSQKQELQQQLDAVLAELDKAKTAGVLPTSLVGVVEDVGAKLTPATAPADTSKPQSTVENKWKSVEDKVVSLEEQVVSKAKEFESSLEKKSGATAQSGQGNAGPSLVATPRVKGPVGFDPGRTVVLGGIKNLPVAAWLVVLNGTQKGEDFRLLEGKNMLGNAAGANIKLRDPAVSAEHASINYREGKFFITDLDSTNGTFINDESEPLARVELRDNDVIRLGETSLKFKCL